ncbi:MAG TPA: hypothetical protein VMB71_11655 [Acetobacteraceae bacterium]|nr:hypothetical protein [Acetobacteraceae bacterium]
MVPAAKIAVSRSDLVASLSFGCAEEAWFWTMGALRNRRDGARRNHASIPRPCEPDDVIRCLDRLYQQRQITLTHARVLRTWGERQLAPDLRQPDSPDTRLWLEAMARLAPALRHKGIIA